MFLVWHASSFLALYMSNLMFKGPAPKRTFTKYCLTQLISKFPITDQIGKYLGIGSDCQCTIDLMLCGVWGRRCVLGCIPAVPMKQPKACVIYCTSWQDIIVMTALVIIKWLHIILSISSETRYKLVINRDNIIYLFTPTRASLYLTLSPIRLFMHFVEVCFD